jgi:tetratricopeptide (TPR) repeat protein
MAQALNRQTLVLMRRGELKQALDSAVSALKLSEQTKQKSLIAMSLLRLSEARQRTGRSQESIETAQQAIPLFRELGDTTGEGRAVWATSTPYYRLGRVQDSRRASQTSLDLARAAGDQLGIGNALNSFTFSDIDLAESKSHLEQAIQAFEAAGYKERYSVAIGNLAIVYYALGLYLHSYRLQSEATEINRATGAKAGLTYSVQNLFDVEVALGKLDAARLHLKEFEVLASALGQPVMEAAVPLGRANLLFAEGDIESAIRFYKSTAELSEELKDENLQFSVQTLLGKAYLANNNPREALIATTRATDLHRATSFAKPDTTIYAQEIWWWHAQALLANRKKAEAYKALEQAHDLLLDSIKNIRDVGLRRNALNKVEINRAIIAAWLKSGGEHKLPKERLYAHLEIESNVREPFQRLADTGVDS